MNTEVKGKAMIKIEFNNDLNFYTLTNESGDTFTFFDTYRNSGLTEFIESARKGKSATDTESKCNKHIVSKSVCPKCNDTGSRYSESFEKYIPCDCKQTDC